MRKFMNYLQMQPSRIFLLFFLDRYDFIERWHAIFKTRTRQAKLFYQNVVECGKGQKTIYYLLFATFLLRDHLNVCKKLFYQTSRFIQAQEFSIEAMKSSRILFSLADKDKTVFVSKVVYTLFSVFHKH